MEINKGESAHRTDASARLADVGLCEKEVGAWMMGFEPRSVFIKPFIDTTRYIYDKKKQQQFMKISSPF